MDWVQRATLLLQIVTVASLSQNSTFYGITCLKRMEGGKSMMYIKHVPSGIEKHCEYGTCENLQEIGIYKDDFKSIEICENCCGKTIPRNTTKDQPSSSKDSSSKDSSSKDSSSKDSSSKDSSNNDSSSKDSSSKDSSSKDSSSKDSSNNDSSNNDSSINVWIAVVSILGGFTLILFSIGLACYIKHRRRSDEDGDVEMQMLPQGANPPLPQPVPDSGDGNLPLAQQVSEEGA